MRSNPVVTEEPKVATVDNNLDTVVDLTADSNNAEDMVVVTRVANKQVMD